VSAQWVTESSRDPIILGSVTIVLLLVAALACFVPARRAAGIQPMEAVRHD
jgi:putative ABC transport system permease protein